MMIKDKVKAAKFKNKYQKTWTYWHITHKVGLLKIVDWSKNKRKYYLQRRIQEAHAVIRVKHNLAKIIKLLEQNKATGNNKKSDSDLKKYLKVSAKIAQKLQKAEETELARKVKKWIRNNK